MTQTWSLKRFYILLFILVIAGVTQGLLIPLLTTLLEQKGYSSDLNGLNAAFLYAGIFLMSLICPAIVPRWGYRLSLFVGIGIDFVAIGLIPFFDGLWSWAVLRFIVGIGDSLLHYTTQLWITETVPEQERGKRISQYGFSYGFGFGLGPLGMTLADYGIWVPIGLVEVLLLFSLFLVSRLDHGKIEVEQTEKTAKEKGQLKLIYRVGLVALCPAFLYGYLEAALTGNFPIYGLRIGLSEEWISTLITAFVWGSLLFQIPLGMLADRIGRKKILIIVCALGALGMMMIPPLGANEIWLFLLFVSIGGLVGSLYSLGLSYLTDLLPARYMAVAGAIATIHFSIGSILGPYLGGVLMKWFSAGVLFYFISFVLLIFVALALFYPVPKMVENRNKSMAS
jgi:MFS family permease